MTEQEIAGEINGYKQQLEQSDYKVMKAVERIFSASSITTCSRPSPQLPRRWPRSSRSARRGATASTSWKPWSPTSRKRRRSSGRPFGGAFLLPGDTSRTIAAAIREGEKTNDDVLEIFAPYGPGSLFGALLVLVVLYFGKQFLRDSRPRTSARRTSTSSAKSESRTRWTSGRSATASAARWRAASPRRWSAATR